MSKGYAELIFVYLFYYLRLTASVIFLSVEYFDFHFVTFLSRGQFEIKHFNRDVLKHATHVYSHVYHSSDGRNFLLHNIDWEDLEGQYGTILHYNTVSSGYWAVISSQCSGQSHNEPGTSMLVKTVHMELAIRVHLSPYNHVPKAVIFPRQN